MNGSTNSLSEAISKADTQLTVLDDRVDAEEHAEYLWLKAHVLRGYGNHRVVIGIDVLPSDWRAKQVRFPDLVGATSYLHHFDHNHLAVSSLQKLARSMNSGNLTPLSDSQALDIVAHSLVAGRVWAIELPKRPPISRFISKTSPTAFAPLNPRFGAKVDFAFIASLEGDQWLRGYVPMRGGVVVGKSGMTVASGFDVGQWSVEQWKKFGFPKTLLDKISPFASHSFRKMSKKQVAAEVGKIGPVPELTQSEADLCDGAVFGEELGGAIEAWNKVKKPNVPLFALLPSGWQTVWFSRVYQEGANPVNSEAIAFRTQATSGNWKQAIEKLRAYTNYKQRTQQEAELLSRELPAPVASAPVAPSPAAAAQGNPK